MKEKIYIYICPFPKGTGSGLLTVRGLEEYRKEEDLPEGPEDPEIREGSPHKKPYFQACPEIFHNVSHSGDWWACAYGKEEVGLDLQRKEKKDTKKLAERFFHPREIAWLKDRPDDQFYRLWAYKESYLKYTGTGLVEGLDHFSVIPSGYGKAGEMKPGAEGVCQCEIPFPDKDYWMVLTTEKPREIICRLLK
ncbi:MAG: 4'-phosphopantetheinyl transferase superfamily protein [Eubacterium sp.]|nr:4'-phosphopantetheinyl transferase superfamily protein [Eubacterium sp.]